MFLALIKAVSSTTVARWFLEGQQVLTHPCLVRGASSMASNFGSAMNDILKAADWNSESVILL